MYLMKYRREDGSSVAALMTMSRIANIYGDSKHNETLDHKVFRLHPDKDPEQLVLEEVRDAGLHTVALWTENGEYVDEADWPEQ